MSIEMSLSGGKECLAMLQRIPAKDAKRAIRKGTRKGARFLLAAARERAPVNTGLLRRKLTIKGLRRKNQLGSMVVGGTREQMGIDAKSRGYYPAVKEYGSRKTNQRAIKYMQRGASVASGVATQTAVAEIKAAINQAKA